MSRTNAPAACDHPDCGGFWHDTDDGAVPCPVNKPPPADPDPVEEEPRPEYEPTDKWWDK